MSDSLLMFDYDSLRRVLMNFAEIISLKSNHDVEFEDVVPQGIIGFDFKIVNKKTNEEVLKIINMYLKCLTEMDENKCYCEEFRKYNLFPYLIYNDGTVMMMFSNMNECPNSEWVILIPDMISMIEFIDDGDEKTIFWKERYEYKLYLTIYSDLLEFNQTYYEMLKENKKLNDVFNYNEYRDVLNNEHNKKYSKK